MESRPVTKIGGTFGVLVLVAFLVFVGQSCQRKSEAGTVGGDYRIDFEFHPWEDYDSELELAAARAKTGGVRGIFDLANLYGKLGMFAKADSLFALAAEEAPRDVGLLLAVGEYFERYRREPERAAFYYEKAIELKSPLRDEAVYRLGYTFLRQRDVNKAVRLWIDNSHNASNWDVWRRILDVLGEVNRSSARKKIAEVLSTKFSEDEIFEVLLECCHTFVNSERVLEKMMNTQPFVQDEWLLDGFFDRIDSDSLRDLLVSKNEVSRYIAAMYILSHNLDSLKSLAVAALASLVRNDESKCRFVEFLSAIGEYRYAYMYANSYYSQIQNDSLKEIIRSMAIKSLINCEDNKTYFAKIWELSSSEPELVNGVFSVLLNRKSVDIFKADFFNSEGNFYRDYVVERFLNELNNDVVNRKDLCQFLSKYYESRGEYGKALQYLAVARKLYPDDLNLRARMVMLLLKLKKNDDAAGEYANLLQDFAQDTELSKIIDQFRWSVDFKRCSACGKVSSKYLDMWIEDPSLAETDNLIALFEYYYNSLSSNRREKFVKNRLLNLFSKHIYNNFLVNTAVRHNLVFEDSLWYRYPWVGRFRKVYIDSIFKTGDPDSLRLYYKKLAEKYPKKLIYSLLAGEISYRLSHFDDAYRFYENVLSLKPGWFTALNLEMELAKSEGRTRKLADLLRRVVYSYPESVNVAEFASVCSEIMFGSESIIELPIYDSPLKSVSWSKVAVVYWDLEEYRKGIDILEQARNFFGDNSKFARQMFAFYSKIGDINNAIKEYINIIATVDNWEIDQVVNELVYFAKQNNLLGSISSEFERRIHKNPSPKLLKGYIKYHLALGDTNKVRRVIEDLVNKTDSDSLLLEIASVAVDLKMYDVQTAVYLKLYDLTKDVSYLVRSMGNENTYKNPGKTEKIWEQIVAKDNAFLPMYADFCEKLKKYDKAIELYKRFLALDSTKWNLYIKIARLYKIEHKLKKAEQVLKSGIDKTSKCGDNARIAARKLRIELIKTIASENNTARLTESLVDLVNTYPLDRNILRLAWYISDKNNIDFVKYYESLSQKSYKDYRWNVVLFYFYLWSNKIKLAREELIKSCINEPLKFDIWTKRWYLDILERDTADVRKIETHFQDVDWQADSLFLYCWLSMEDSLRVKDFYRSKIVNSRSDYSRNLLLLDLLERGYFKYARELADKFLRSPDKYADYRYELLLKLFELNENPDSILALILNRMKVAENGYSWQVELFIDKFINDAENWHYISNLVDNPDILMDIVPSYKDYVLQELYMSGGAIDKLARVIYEEDLDSAVALLFNSQYYNELTSMLSLDDWYRFETYKPIIYWGVSEYYIGKKSEGERIIKSAPERAPFNPYAYLDVAKAFSDIRDYEQAQDYMKIAISLQKYPDERFIRSLINLYISNGDTDIAVDSLLNISNRNPDIWQVKKLFEIGKDSLAEIVADRVLNELVSGNEYYYDYITSFEEIIRALAVRKKYDVIERFARKVSNALTDDWSKSEYISTVARVLIDYSPEKTLELLKTTGRNSTDNLQIWGECYFKLGRYGDLFDLFDGENFYSLDLDEKLLLMKCYYASGDTSTGDALAYTILLDDFAPDAFAKVISVSAEYSRIKLAYNLASVAEKIWAGVPELWLPIAKTKLISGRYSEAIKWLEKSMFYFGEGNLSYESIGYWAKYSAKHNYKLYYNSAVSRVNGKIPYHKKFALLQYCALYNRYIGNYPEAAHWTDKLVENFPHDRQAYLFAANLMKSINYRDRARKYESILSRRFPQGSDSYLY